MCGFIREGIFAKATDSIQVPIGSDGEIALSLRTAAEFLDNRGGGG